MGRPKTKSRGDKEPRELDPEKDGPVEPGTVDDPEAYERALEEGTLEELPPPRKPREPQTALPDRSIQLTARRCLLARTRDPIVAAFLHAEHLRGETRKMTREQWDQELEAFKSAPR